VIPLDCDGAKCNESPTPAPMPVPATPAPTSKTPGFTAQDFLYMVMLPVELTEMSTFTTRRINANQFSAMEKVDNGDLLKRLGFVSPQWFQYYTQATTVENEPYFQALGELYFAQGLEEGGGLPCTVSSKSTGGTLLSGIDAITDRSNQIWDTDEGKDMLSSIRNLAFEKMSGGRPNPTHAHSWDYYLAPARVKNMAVAFAALVTSPRVAAILGTCDSATVSKLFSMVSQILYTLNSQFLPTQSTTMSEPNCDSADQKLATAESSTVASDVTANIVTNNIMRMLQQNVAADSTINVRLSPGVSTESYQRLAASTVDQMQTAPSGSALNEILSTWISMSGTAAGLTDVLANTADACAKTGCSSTVYQQTVNSVITSTGLPALNNDMAIRMGEITAAGGFFLDLGSDILGDTWTWQSEMALANDAVGVFGAFGVTSKFVVDQAAALLTSTFNALSRAIVSMANFAETYLFAGMSVAQASVEYLANAVTTAISNTLKSVAKVTTSLSTIGSVSVAVLGGVVAGVGVVTGIIAAIAAFTTGNIIAGTSAVISATSAAIGVASAVLTVDAILFGASALTATQPYLFPIAVALAVTGFIVGLFAKPPPPPPTGPQLLCNELCSSSFPLGAMCSHTDADPGATSVPSAYFVVAENVVLWDQQACLQYPPMEAANAAALKPVDGNGESCFIYNPRYPQHTLQDQVCTWHVESLAGPATDSNVVHDAMCADNGFPTLATTCMFTGEMVLQASWTRNGDGTYQLAPFAPAVDYDGMAPVYLVTDVRAGELATTGIEMIPGTAPQESYQGHTYTETSNWNLWLKNFKEPLLGSGLGRPLVTIGHQGNTYPEGDDQMAQSASDLNCATFNGGSEDVKQTLVPYCYGPFGCLDAGTSNPKCLGPKRRRLLSTTEATPIMPLSTPSRKLFGSGASAQTAYQYSGSGASICAEFQTTRKASDLQTDAAKYNTAVGIGRCMDHEFWTKLSETGVFPAGSILEGVEYTIWVRNQQCNSMVSYTPNKFDIGSGFVDGVPTPEPPPPAPPPISCPTIRAGYYDDYDD